MSAIRRLVSTTAEGTLLISEIQETVDLGKKDDDAQVGMLFDECWRVLQALIEQDLRPAECLRAVNAIINRLEARAKEKDGQERKGIQQLVRKVRQNIVKEYLQQII